MLSYSTYLKKHLGLNIFVYIHKCCKHTNSNSKPYKESSIFISQSMMFDHKHVLHSIYHIVHTQSMLDNKLSTEDDYERKTFLNPAKEVTKFRE